MAEQKLNFYTEDEINGWITSSSCDISQADVTRARQKLSSVDYSQE